MNEHNAPSPDNGGAEDNSADFKISKEHASLIATNQSLEVKLDLSEKHAEEIRERDETIATMREKINWLNADYQQLLIKNGALSREQNRTVRLYNQELRRRNTLSAVSATLFGIGCSLVAADIVNSSFTWPAVLFIIFGIIMHLATHTKVKL